MDFVSIFSSLRRSALGPVLIGLQVALTLAILLNAAGIVQQHAQRMRSASGVDEANVFTLVNRWVGAPSFEQSRSMVARDLAILRATPGVQAAVSTNGVPLAHRGWGTRVDTKPVDPASQGSLTRAQLYVLDEQGLDALGLHLQQGRWFTADEAAGAGQSGSGFAILTRALAAHLFPDGNALGKLVYTSPRGNLVVGIVDTLQASAPGDPDVSLEVAQYSIALPGKMAQQTLNNYIVRTKPGALQAAMKEAERRLREADPQRVITEFKTFAETRQDSYRANRALTTILVTVNLLLIVITALGVAGLASYWVAQRQRMIGVRRALGATRLDILAYFHAENLVIVTAGVLLGLGLAIALNTQLVKAGVPRIDNMYLWGGVVAVFLTGQLAVLLPALRAARVPPALATRSG
ncbi:MAG TPA: FtsX-like permease family protein [Rhizomicrobium sp.]|jgi:putative ABC transport system permease protein|nr:FtsX-like permease family protein [Rhizomicrobium sp.]